MSSSLEETSDPPTEEVACDVAGLHGGAYIGPSGIRRSSDFESDRELEATANVASLELPTAQAQLDALVAACGGVYDPSPFGKHKEQLLTDLVPPYALFRFLKEHPELLNSLREHEALKDRVRRISEAKTALLCIYCKMRPATPEERSSCSDWTIWLEQADHSNKEVGDFVAWGMGRNFKDCRDEVRARRKASKSSGGSSATSVGRQPQFKLRETEKGASVTLGGRQFSISKAVLKRVIAMIEQAAAEEMINMNNDNDAGDNHE